MAVPSVVIANRAPAPGSVGNVSDTFRFSLRSQGDEIDRSTLETYLGAGPLFYQGDVLPEDVPDKTFSLESFTGVPATPADQIARSIISGELKLTKAAATLEASSYFFGRLEAPAEPDAVLMGEFTLRMNKADQTPDGDDFTGVHYGFFINDTGLAVKFFTDGATQKIEIHDAGVSTSTPPSGAFVSAFDWDAVEYTYKVLWDPRRDVVRLYVSTGKDALTSDTLLIDSTISGNFPTLPPSEIRPVQPVAFFGHTGSVADGISFWSAVSLQNLSNLAILGGIAVGGHTGFIESNNHSIYDGNALPRDDNSPWNILPDTFGTINGREVIDSNGVLSLTREDVLTSFGFFRLESQVVSGITVLDFTLRGTLLFSDPTSESSGIEIYIDDEIQSVRFALLQDSVGDQFIGLLKGAGSPDSIVSYDSLQTGWGVERDYRLIFRKGVEARLLQIADEGSGLVEKLIAFVADADLPASSFPGPGIGFLHNGVSAVAAAATLHLRRFQYSTLVRAMEGSDSFPENGWTIQAPGTDLSGVWTWGGPSLTILSTDTSEVEIGDFIRLNSDGQLFQIAAIVPNTSVDLLNPQSRTIPSTGPGTTSKVDLSNIDSTDGLLTLDNPTESDSLSFRRADSMGFGDGLTMEFSARVNSYEVSGVQDPPRELTGVSAGWDDGTFRTFLVFADAGPQLGRIAFLSTIADVEQNLIDIRSGEESVEGTYFSVDWTVLHTYRIEKIVGGRLQVFLDNAEAPELDFDAATFSYAPTDGLGIRAEFGEALLDRKSSSSWAHLRYSVSDGFDVSLQSDREELLFDHAFNVIVTVEDTVP